MSKNISIQEGGTAKQLSPDKLKTNLVGGGTCLWVPEDETQLTTKHISENGTYKASDDGYYGYSEVTVSGIGTATGTDNDGDTAVAHTGSGGQLIVDKVPSRIEVITPPTNPYGVYINGQSISTDGMVVKAYYETGGEYGIVPNAEITLDPATAIYDPSSYSDATATSDLVPYTINLSTEIHAEYGTTTPPSTMTDRASPGSTLYTAQQYDGAYRCYYAKCSGSDVFSGFHRTYTHDNKTVYYYPVVNLDSLRNVTPTPIRSEYTEIDEDKTAWTAIYGTFTQAGSRQEITVSWPRPYDGEVLTTTFTILVAPPYSIDDESFPGE